MTRAEVTPHRVVWKFLLTAPVTEHDMPHGAEIIDVRSQDGTPALWALCNPTGPTVRRTFVGHGTGHPITEPGLVYVGSAHDVDGIGLVFHIFERTSR